MLFKRHLSRSQTNPNRIYARRNLCRRLEHESLESRHLLATVQFSDPIPTADPTVTQSTAQYPAPDNPELAQDGTVRFELDSIGTERVAIRLRADRTDYSIPFNVQILGPNGSELEGWIVHEESRNEIFLAGTTGPDHGTTTFVLDGVQTWAYAEAHHGITIFSEDTPEFPPLDVLPATADWQPSGRLVAGFVKSTADGPVEFQYNAENLVPNDWTSTAVGNGSVDFESEIVVRTGESISPERFRDGVLVNYESDTGNLSFHTHSSTSLTTFELKSKSNWFQGVKPGIIAENVFNVFRPDKIFVLDTQGVSHVDFGRVLPSGLSKSELEADLSFDGSHRSGPRPDALVYSIDGGVSIETANIPVREWFTPNRIRAHGTTKANAPGLISFAYKWDGATVTNGRPSGQQTKATVEYRTESFGRSSMQLEACEDWCRKQIVLDKRGGASSTSEEFVDISFENQSISTNLVVRDLQIFGKPPVETHSFSIPVHANHSVTVNAETSANVQLLDANGQLVTTARRFTLAAPNEGVENYELQIQSGSASYLLSVESQNPESPIQVDQASTRIDAGRLIMRWSDVIDLRTCGLNDFMWDGPAFVTIQVEQKWGTEIQLEFTDALDPGYYNLEIREGACVGLHSGRSPESPLVVDFVPPEIAEIPIATSRWIKRGDGVFAIRFNESVNAWHHQIRLQRLDDDGTFAVVDNVPENLLLSIGETLLVDLGDLQSGEYLVELNVDGSDRSGNRMPSHPLTLPFIVSDTPPPGIVISRFDLDQNGTVNRNDFDLLSAWSSTKYRQTNGHDRFDLTGDGLADHQDMRLLARGGMKSPIGDVDLDGDFDQEDLDILAAFARDGYYHSYLLHPNAGYIDSLWTQGDFNGDGWFDSADLVAAFSALDSPLESGDGLLDQ